MVLTHKPGEKLFVDFAGKKLFYIDQQTGEIIECPVFFACLKILKLFTLKYHTVIVSFNSSFIFF
jgi:hypothetical protein